jgi:hypothetical protein
MKFTIEPFVGALPLRFGMRPEEVAAIVGPPSGIYLSSFEDQCEERSTLSMDLAYHRETGKLNELVFAPGSILYFNGQNLFDVSNVIDFLRQSDSDPKIAVGMVFFLKLGIRLSGFHDGDESQKAVGVTPKGHWDEFMEDFEDM